MNVHPPIFWVTANLCWQTNNFLQSILERWFSWLNLDVLCQLFWINFIFFTLSCTQDSLTLEVGIASGIISLQVMLLILFNKLRYVSIWKHIIVFLLHKLFEHSRKLLKELCMSLQENHRILDLDRHGIKFGLTNLLFMSLRNTFYPEGYHGSILGWEKLKLLNHGHHGSLFCLLILVRSCEYLVLTTLEKIRKLRKFSQKLLEMEASLFEEPDIFVSIITKKFWLWQSWYIQAWKPI